MKNTWDEIDSWLKQNAPHVLINPGASIEELTQTQTCLGITFPDDFQQSYQIHNGQQWESPGMFDGSRLLSLDEIVSEWQIWKELLDRGEFEEYSSEPDNGIKDDWWNPCWIPITSDGSGNHKCLDLDPAAGGQRGQIITMWHDDAERKIVAPSFAAWLKDYSAALQSGQCSYLVESV